MYAHMTLAKKCIPCEGNVPPLGLAEIEQFKQELQSGWQVLDNKKLQREFVFKDFLHAMAFVDAVADIAESEDHHPDIHVYYNKVILELATHAIKGLSENDFIVAAQIDELQKYHPLK